MIWFGSNVSGGLQADDADLIGAANRGYTVGQGVFETVIVRQGQPFFLDRHLERLGQSASISRLPQPNIALIRTAIELTIEANLLAIGDLGRLRVTYTAGESSNAPTILVTCTQQPPWPVTTSAITVQWVRNERSAITGAKSTSYAENVIALDFAHERSASEAIFANGAGNLCEGATSNVFVVIDGEVLTPPLSSGCLPGVTRGLVIEWFGAQERDIEFTSLDQVSELFLTSTTRGVHPVTKLDERVLAVGDITRRLQSEFLQRISSHPNP